MKNEIIESYTDKNGNKWHVEIKKKLCRRKIQGIVSERQKVRSSGKSLGT